MGEHFSGPYTHHYVAYQGHYFTRMVDATDRSTWITVQEISGKRDVHPSTGQFGTMCVCSKDVKPTSAPVV
jgi:hypothetical protein